MILDVSVSVSEMEKKKRYRAMPRFLALYYLLNL